MQPEAEDDAGQKKKRDALRGNQTVPFSMFDPIVAFDAISGNWINVPEVAKLGIQAAHKKLGLAREERTEMQTAMTNMQRQLRGIQEHHVQQMNSTISRVDFLERSTKRKKKFNGSNDFALDIRSEPKSSRKSVGRRQTNIEAFDEESSSEASHPGVTPQQQELLEKIEPMERSLADLQAGFGKAKQRSDALLKRIDKEAHYIELLENRLNDELSTRSLSLLFRQLIFNELPATLETFTGERMQGFKKLVENLEKKLEGEIATVARREQHHQKSLQGLGERLRDLEAAVQGLQDGSSSSSEADAQRDLAREASRKLFAGGSSPRSSRAGRMDEPLTSGHEAPAIAGVDAPGLGAVSELAERGEASAEVPSGAASGGTVTVPGRFHMSEAEGELTRHEEPEVEHPGTEAQPKEEDSPRRSFEDAVQSRRKPGRRRPQPSSRASTLRTQQSNLTSELSEDYGSLSPRPSNAMDGLKAQAPPAVSVAAMEDFVKDFARSEKFKSILDQQTDFSFTRQCVQKLSSLVPDLKDDQLKFQEELQQTRRDVARNDLALSEVDRRLAAASKLQQQLDVLENRMLKAENFSERGIDAILASTEGRLLEFLSEAEAERALLWQQMSVLFPRFIKDECEGKPRMTMSEARGYALDVRLDHLEEFIVKMSARDAGESVAKPNREGHQTRESSPSLSPSLSPSSSARRAQSFEPRFSVAERFPKATRGSRLAEAYRQLQESLQPDLPIGESHEDASVVEPPPSLLREVKESKKASLSVIFDDKVKEVDGSPDTGDAMEKSEVLVKSDPDEEAKLSPAPKTRPSEKLRGRSVDEALSEVLDGARSVDAGEVQLIRALNPRSPNAWLIGDAAAGRVILGQDQPGRRRDSFRRR